MISDAFGIITVLLVIEGLVFYLSEQKRTAKFFNVMPPMFWIYFLPMVFTTIGIIPRKSEVYQLISSNFLPASLVLLLISVDMRAVLRLGGKALIMMFAGSLGIFLGGPIVFFIFKGWLPEGAWSGFGALSASWIGGSVNMLAVKEGIGTPDAVFFPMVVVDTVVPYVWMGLLIALAGYQAVFDKWNRSDRKVLDDLNKKLAGFKQGSTKPLTTKHIAIMIGMAAICTYTAMRIAAVLPEIKNVVSAYTWTIMIVSAIGIALSCTGAKKLEDFGASRIGYGMLYFVLASIGARASLADITAAPVLILAGFLWIGIHAAFLIVTARIIRAPLFLIATASQANIGGPASAPVVAAVYEPHLALVGLLLALLGNIMGTYFGIMCAQLCKMVSG